jgi:hypothetical protein
MTRHANWRARDHLQWAVLLHTWGEDKLAWQILSEFVSEPDLPKNPPKMALDQLEIKWRLAPKNFVIAQELAMARYLAGNTKGGDEVIVAAGLEEGSPQRFVHKAAYVLARSGRFGEAVALVLRGPTKL